MSVTISSATAFSTGTGTASSVTVTKPSGAVSGDLLLIYCARGTASTTWSATNFTAVTAATGTSGACQFIYRLLDGSGSDPGATFSVSCSATAQWAGICMRVTGEDPSLYDPSPTSGQINASSSTVTAPGITTTVNGDLLVWCGGIDSASGGTPAVLTLPGGYTDSGAGQSNSTRSTGTNAGVLAGFIVQATAGATGTVSGSAASAHVNMGALVGVKAAAAAGLLPQQLHHRTIRRDGHPALASSYR